MGPWEEYNKKNENDLLSWRKWWFSIRGPIIGTCTIHVLNQKPTTAAQYVDEARTYESMCKLGNPEAARLKPPPLKIVTILGTSPLHEVARESEAIDQTARESITQMTEAIKTMGKVIEKNENENKQLKKKVGQLAPTLQYCTYCNRSGHPDSICWARIADEQKPFCKLIFKW